MGEAREGVPGPGSREEGWGRPGKGSQEQRAGRNPYVNLTKDDNIICVKLIKDDYNPCVKLLKKMTIPV